jgi:hypothetical protein
MDKSSTSLSLSTSTTTNSISSIVTNPLVILTVLVVIIIMIILTNIFSSDLGYGYSSGYGQSSGLFGYSSRPVYYEQHTSIFGYIIYFIYLAIFLVGIYFVLYYLFGIEFFSFVYNYFFPGNNPNYPISTVYPTQSTSSSLTNTPTPPNNFISTSTYLNNIGNNSPLTTTPYINTKSTTPLPNTTTSNNTQTQEVYNVPGNYYTYDDANAVCKAFGGRLAKYKEVEDAYNNGGEWCNYGWSDEQMALFPTQQGTYDALQKKKGSEHNCGRPGINGGYLANPNIKFGANCYGVKPQINSQEQQNMINVSSLPLTQDDINFQKKVDYWKGQIDNIMLAPFNYNEWYETQNVTNLTTSPNPTVAPTPQQKTPYITQVQTTPYAPNAIPTLATTNKNSITYPIVTNKSKTSASPVPSSTTPYAHSTTNPNQSLTPMITSTPTVTQTVTPTPTLIPTMTTPQSSSWWDTFMYYFTFSTYYPTPSNTTPFVDTSSTPFSSSYSSSYYTNTNNTSTTTSPF